jgi:hypothetical protein
MGVVFCLFTLVAFDYSSEEGAGDHSEVGQLARNTIEECSSWTTD